MESVKKGDYVLATKYFDGDPRDDWVVGFFEYEKNRLFYIVDAHGNLFKAGGFRRVKRISNNRGRFILENKDNILTGTRSLWRWVRCSMKKYDTRGCE